jgi:hypothetical protein
MPRHDMINGVAVPYTPAEEDARDAEEAISNAAKPLKRWAANMRTSDNHLPRYAEDLYDALNPVDQANASQVTKDKVAAKKALRGQKP